MNNKDDGAKLPEIRVRNKPTVCITLDPDICIDVDLARGVIPRSIYIQLAVEEKLARDYPDRTKLHCLKPQHDIETPIRDTQYLSVAERNRFCMQWCYHCENAGNRPWLCTIVDDPDIKDNREEMYVDADKINRCLSRKQFVERMLKKPMQPIGKEDPGED